MAAMLCEGAGGQDFANITNFAAQCGLVWGVPQRTDGVDDLMFLPGSEWTTPMYSCITAAQAIIKTVEFRFNITDNLSGLEVVSIMDKTYPNDDAKPLWGVENTEIPLADARALWGLVSPALANQTANLSILRKESLLLPGYSSSGVFTTSYENLPGVDFHSEAIGTAYSIGSEGQDVPDYSGRTNLAMFQRWKALSNSSDSIAKIMDLVWTDVAANDVLGTKSLAATQGNNIQKRDTTTGNVAIPVTMYDRQIKYHLVYAIPAIIVLALLVLSSFLTCCAVLFGRASPSKMKRYLNTTSAGRIMTSNFQGQVDNDVSTKVWIANSGKIPFTVGRGKAEPAGVKSDSENESFFKTG